ncbi:MAG: type II toxin-antitoxin system HicB family antitoxin [Lachnospiraceae bacterium]|jgi:predicted RNase H-like HicB family nuclease|nr:type II toxin-antitoxin system HicB family antitoxin [Lachnospiraceae bacterium]
MLKYSILIQYDDKDNIFVASVPELEGCMAHGSTQEEAIKEVGTAMRLWLETAAENGDAIPEPLMCKVS